MSLSRSKENTPERERGHKDKDEKTEDTDGDLDDPNNDGLATPTDSPQRDTSKLSNAPTIVVNGSPRQRASFTFPVVSGSGGNDSRKPRIGGHARSISQQVDIDSLEWNNSPTPSDDTHSDMSDERNYPYKEGQVSKWTNYVTGWQNRWLVLKNGYLSYYRKKDEDSICRGTVELAIAFVQKHEFDSLRLDVQFVDQFYYLRAPTKSERDAWFDAILQTQMLSELPGGMHKSGSMASLTSMTSINSVGSGLASSSGSIRTAAFTDKLNEVKTFKNLIQSLVDKLQNAAPSQSEKESYDDQFRADLLMMKSTATGMLSALEDAIDIAQRREEEWRKRLRRANEKRHKFEGLFRTAQAAAKQTAAQSGPDMQEGPHSLLTEEAWFDAIDNATGPQSPEPGKGEESTDTPTQASLDENQDEAAEKPKSKWELIADESRKETIAFKEEMAKSNKFEIVTQDDEMTISRADGMMDEVAIDLNRTEATFHGITARELVRYFSDCKYKMDWELTLAGVRVLESLPEMKAEIYELDMKRIWPSAARNCILLTQEVKLDGEGEWLAHNISVDHPKLPLAEAGDVVRVQVKSALFAKTIIKPGVEGTPTRADISCSVEYYAQINPGGWAPPSVVSSVSRREFPKTLRSLGTHSVQHFAKLPIDNS